MEFETEAAAPGAAAASTTPGGAYNEPVAAAGPPSVEQLTAELNEARARAEENQNRYLYALADLENQRKQNEKRVADRLALLRRSTLVKFLPVLDNLQRALSFEQDSAGLRGGLNATMRGFEAVIASEGVTPLDLAGKPFDPRFAEAIEVRESSEHDDDVVIEELERGYMLGEELLRPARVVVSKRAE